MDLETLTKILNDNKGELRQLGVKSLAVFGSTARNEATLSSDVDLLIEFQQSPTFDLYMDARFFLEKILERRVDLVMRTALKPRIRERVESEAVYVA